MKPSEEEINRRIAEFMEGDDFARYVELRYKDLGDILSVHHFEFARLNCFYKDRSMYTISLGALVPVAENLREIFPSFDLVSFAEKDKYCAGFLPINESDLEYIEYEACAKTEALARSTAIYNVLENIE